MEDISEKMVFLYEKIRAMVKKKAKKENVNPCEIDFIQTEVKLIEDIEMGFEFGL